MSKENGSSQSSDQELLPKGAVTWFEIPTEEIARAVRFYEAVLAAKLDDVSHDEAMFIFPSHGGEITGALVQRLMMQPGTQGPLIYLRVEGDLSTAVKRVEPAGGTVLVPPMTVQNAPGTFCVVRDTEGNHVGIHAQQ